MISIPVFKRNTNDKKKNMMTGGNNNSSRTRNQRLLLLLAIGAALLGVMLLHKLRQGRIYGLLLQDRDRQVITLQLLLQRQMEKSKDTKRKLQDQRAKIFILRNQKGELTDKLTETRATVDHLMKIQKEMETTLDEKQNQINRLSENPVESIAANLQVTTLTELLKQKEAEVEEMKQQLMKTSSTLETNNTTPRDEIIENLPNSTREGKWVNFQTNVDQEGLKAEGDVSEVQRKHGDERSQESTTETEEKSEELNNDEGKAYKEEEKEEANGDTNQSSSSEIEEHKNNEEKEEELQTSEGNTLEITEQNTELKSGNGEVEKAYDRMRHHGHRRSKRRRRREMEKKSDGDSGKTPSGENLSGSQDSDNNITIEDINNVHGNKEKNEDGDHSETVSSNTILQDTTPNTEGQINSEGESSEREERSDDDSNQQLPNNQNGDENFSESQDNAQGQSNSEGKTEVREEDSEDTNHRQLAAAQDQEEGNGDDKGDKLDMITREETSSTQGKSEESEYEANNISNDDPAGAVADWSQESVAEKQSEVHNDDEHQSQLSTTENSNVSKEEVVEVTENKNSESTA